MNGDRILIKSSFDLISGAKSERTEETFGIEAINIGKIQPYFRKTFREFCENLFLFWLPMELNQSFKNSIITKSYSHN